MVAKAVLALWLVVNKSWTGVMVSVSLVSSANLYRFFICPVDRCLGSTALEALVKFHSE